MGSQDVASGLESAPGWPRDHLRGAGVSFHLPVPWCGFSGFDMVDNGFAVFLQREGMMSGVLNASRVMLRPGFPRNREVGKGEGGTGTKRGSMQGSGMCGTS